MTPDVIAILQVIIGIALIVWWASILWTTRVEKEEEIPQRRIVVLSLILGVVLVTGIVMYAYDSWPQSHAGLISGVGLFLTSAAIYVPVHLVRYWMHQRGHRGKIDTFLVALIIIGLFVYWMDNIFVIGLSLTGGVMLDLATDGFKQYMFRKSADVSKAPKADTPECPVKCADETKSSNHLVTALLVLLLLNPRNWR